METKTPWYKDASNIISILIALFTVPIAILSLPIVYEYYSGPRIVVIARSPTPFYKSASMIKIVNQGNKPATNVNLLYRIGYPGLGTLNFKWEVVPVFGDLAPEFEIISAPGMVEKLRIETLPPGVEARFTGSVTSDPNNPLEKSPELACNRGAVASYYPMLVEVYSNEGRGRIEWVESPGFMASVERDDKYGFARRIHSDRPEQKIYVSVYVEHSDAKLVRVTDKIPEHFKFGELSPSSLQYETNDDSITVEIRNQCGVSGFWYTLIPQSKWERASVTGSVYIAGEEYDSELHRSFTIERIIRLTSPFSKNQLAADRDNLRRSHR
jgi:hypothetical protein